MVNEFRANIKLMPEGLAIFTRPVQKCPFPAKS
jgi:hypothetical protein